MTIINSNRFFKVCTWFLLATTLSIVVSSLSSPLIYLFHFDKRINDNEVLLAKFGLNLKEEYKYCNHKSLMPNLDLLGRQIIATVFSIPGVWGINDKHYILECAQVSKLYLNTKDSLETFLNWIQSGNINIDLHIVNSDIYKILVKKINDVPKENIISVTNSILEDVNLSSIYEVKFYFKNKEYCFEYLLIKDELVSVNNDKILNADFIPFIKEGVINMICQSLNYSQIQSPINYFETYPLTISTKKTNNNIIANKTNSETNYVININKKILSLINSKYINEVNSEEKDILYEIIFHKNDSDSPCGFYNYSMYKNKINNEFSKKLIFSISEKIEDLMNNTCDNNCIFIDGSIYSLELQNSDNFPVKEIEEFKHYYSNTRTIEQLLYTKKYENSGLPLISSFLNTAIECDDTKYYDMSFLCSKYLIPLSVISNVYKESEKNPNQSVKHVCTFYDARNQCIVYIDLSMILHSNLDTKDKYLEDYQIVNRNIINSLFLFSKMKG